MNPNLIRKPSQTSLKMYVLCVHLRWRRVPINPKHALTALVTLCHAKMAGDLRPLWSPKGMPKWQPAWSSIIQQLLANNFGLSHLRSLRAALYFNGSTGATLRGHPKLSRSRADTLIEMRTDSNATRHTAT